MWALSYFQTGRAATYCQSLINHEHLYGSSCFDTWEEFEKEFIREFMPEDERTQASLTLEGASYFQGTTSVDEYVDNFRALITMAGLNIEPVLYSTNPTNPAIKARLEDAKHVGQTVVLKLRRGLWPTLEKKVAEAEARPQEWDVMAWYSLAKRFDKHEREDAIFRSAQRSVPPGPPKPSFPSRTQPQGHSLFPIQFPDPAPTPTPASCVPAPAQAPLAQGIPMEVDTLRQRFLACRTCYTCGKTGHFSAVCPDHQREHHVLHIPWPSREDSVHILIGRFIRRRANSSIESLSLEPVPSQATEPSTSANLQEVEEQEQQSLSSLSPSIDLDFALLQPDSPSTMSGQRAQSEPAGEEEVRLNNTTIPNFKVTNEVLRQVQDDKLPKRKDGPYFTVDRAPDLMKFLDELEELFQNRKVTEADAKILIAVKYMEYETKKLHYDLAVELNKYRLIPLGQHEKVLKFTREFKLEANKLMGDEPILSNAEAVALYMMAFADEFIMSMRTVMPRPSEKRRIEDPYPIDTIYEVAIYTASFQLATAFGLGMNPLTMGATNPEQLGGRASLNPLSWSQPSAKVTVGESSRTITYPANRTGIKLEGDELSSRLLATMDKNEATLKELNTHLSSGVLASLAKALVNNQGSTPRAIGSGGYNSNHQDRHRFEPRSRDFKCYFCGSPEHGVQDCPIQDEYINMRKWIRKDSNTGKFVLKDGTPAPLGDDRESHAVKVERIAKARGWDVAITKAVMFMTEEEYEDAYAKPMDYSVNDLMETLNGFMTKVTTSNSQLGERMEALEATRRDELSIYNTTVNSHSTSEGPGN
ncbi:hypothetical protein D9758_001006 [Tetrapyrgos nigripes]|uniref:CCHC-type domain-containing protein n=1 Tax=Tetrapyrgos nigripes TaxID=182062 RepID=A0A8H5GZ59_9AGAR|nr:hypothetical protein D9758_001006 [Tetrapyrgos nigripes]